MRIKNYLVFYNSLKLNNMKHFKLGQKVMVNPENDNENYNDFDFIQENTGTNTITIPSGNWTISEDLVIPKNKRFQIEAGARVDMIKGARIISNSPIYSLGEEDRPVTVTSSDTTSQGIMIIKAGDRSSLAYTDFSYLSRPSENGWQLPGAITFFELYLDLIFIFIFSSRFKVNLKYIFINICSGILFCDFIPNLLLFIGGQYHFFILCLLVGCF